MTRIRRSPDSLVSARDILQNAIDAYHKRPESPIAGLAGTNRLPGQYSVPPSHPDQPEKTGAAKMLLGRPSTTGSREYRWGKPEPRPLTRRENSSLAETAPWLLDTPEEEAAAKHEMNRLNGPAGILNRALKAAGKK
jgi:hypothetical protein